MHHGTISKTTGTTTAEITPSSSSIDDAVSPLSSSTNQRKKLSLGSTKTSSLSYLGYIAILSFLIVSQFNLFPSTPILEAYKTSISDVVATTSEQQRGGLATTKSSKEVEKPLLLLHIGPPKTATTTIQHGLHTFYNDLLYGDHIHVCQDDKECGYLAHYIQSCGQNPNITLGRDCFVTQVKSKIE